MDIKALILVAMILSVSFAQTLPNPLASYNLVYGWKQVDFKFSSDQTRTRLINSGEFIPANNVIAGIKVMGHRVYLTVPRWQPGVPATLSYVDFDPQKVEGATTADTKGNT